jgi:alpha-tubulin suppressor-like RCC1 family protein
MKILQISAGRERSVALAQDGTAYGWGAIKRLGATLPPGYPGELCTEKPTEIGHNRYAQPVPQLLNPGEPFAAVADGYVDTVGIRRSGEVMTCRPVVSQERGAARLPVAGLPRSVTQVALTETCGFALNADGAVWSWGGNAFGQLGRRNEVLLEAPAAIGGLAPISALAAGHGHVLALDRAGRVWTWGANGAGQLGRGSLQDSVTPLKVVLPVRVKRIAAGDTHSFALDEAGHLWAWGSNNHGQTGNPSARYFTEPVRVKVDFPIAQLDAGMHYSVATSVQGEVFAWGWNGMGQLGQPELGFSARPLRLKPLANVTAVSAGVGHVLVATDRDVFAWGDNRACACGNFPSVAVQATPNRISFA